MKLHAIALIIPCFAILAACSSAPPTDASSSDLSAKCDEADQCHGALPDLCKVCEGGGDGCAHWACVDHKCVTEYCPTTPTCDCKGALPDICEVCSGGHTECAHWVCDDGVCKTQICP
jgi:hypothetical protein